MWVAAQDMPKMAFSPVNTGFSSTPKGVPLGVDIADRVTIEPIRKQLANQVHIAHHSYVNTERHNAIVNHGMFFDGSLVGAISYAYMLASEPIAGYPSDDYIEVARVTTAVDIPNLASCAMAKSQERFTTGFAQQEDIGLLVTYIHEDYDGSMFKALRGKGWEYDETIRGHQAGNRKERERYGLSTKTAGFANCSLACA